MVPHRENRFRSPETCAHRLPGRPLSVVGRQRHPVLVRSRQLADIHPVELGVRRVDGRPHTRYALHAGVTVLSDPRGQDGGRRGGVGQAPGPRPRLQVRARRDTGESSDELAYFSSRFPRESIYTRLAYASGQRKGVTRKFRSRGVGSIL